jgi:hypothetical protein
MRLPDGLLESRYRGFLILNSHQEILFAACDNSLISYVKLQPPPTMKLFALQQRMQLAASIAVSSPQLKAVQADDDSQG